jgi:pullulanase
LPSYDYGTGDEAEKNDLYTWYNWGYDPVLYFNVEGSYSTYPDGITRLAEYKKMVKGFHDKNIGVVQDIVFNHTLSTGDDRFSIFDKIVPMYFYRVYDNGEYANGSFCGNELATDRPMVRKYIVDNLKYYAKEFHIDGFRFDLMGLMDKQTLVDAYAAVKKINPDTIFYGEGWNMGDVLPVEKKMIQKNVVGTGIAAFNDGIRDNLKGDVFDEHAKGFVQNDKPMTGLVRLKLQIKAQDTGRDKESIPVVDPNEVVNYVSCHDNHTIWDKLKISNPGASYDDIKKMDLLAFAVVVTSQGIPFLGEGDEFGRTKRGVENSYNDNDPTVNPINWNLKSKNNDMFLFYMNMIKLRKEHPAFRMTSKEMVDKNLKFIANAPDNVIAYTLNNNANGDSWKTILIAFNSGKEDYKLDLKGNWNIVVKDLNAGSEVLATGENTLTVSAISTLIAYKN